MKKNRAFVIIKDVYLTYRDDNENHALRVFTAAIAAVAIAVFGSGLLKNAFPVMTLAISVLAGFSFTALFSNHAITTFDLPAPKNENDRQDIKRLRLLGQNFRKRSRLFLIMAVAEIMLILFLSFRIDTIQILDFFSVTMTPYHIQIFDGFAKIISSILIMFAFFIFFEFIYTFYRLSETILSVLEIRNQYFDSHTDN